MKRGKSRIIFDQESSVDSSINILDALPAVTDQGSFLLTFSFFGGGGGGFVHHPKFLKHFKT